MVHDVMLPIALLHQRVLLIIRLLYFLLETVGCPLLKGRTRLAS